MKWEYKYLTFSGHEEHDVIEEALDSYGNDSWELVSAVNLTGGKIPAPYDGCVIGYVLKRQK